MGQDESKPQNKPPVIPSKPDPISATVVQEPPPQEYEGIPVIEPLLIRKGQNEKLFDGSKLDGDDLQDAHKLVRAYFQRISSRINNNEESISSNVRRQLEEFIQLSSLIDKRHDELAARLARMLGLFRSLDDEVKNTTDSLKEAIKQADIIAKRIDPNLPSFNQYCSA